MTGNSTNRRGKAISPEMALLCRLAPRHFRGGLARPDGWGEVDPDGFAAFSARFTLDPVVVQAWLESPALLGACRFETSARIVARYEQGRFRQERLFAVWQEVVAAMSGHGVACMPLKGFALSRYLYGDPLVRLTADLDFLTRPEDAPGFRAVLTALGYARIEPGGTSAAYEEMWARPDPDAKEFIPLDIHLNVLPPWHFLWAPPQPLWERAVRAETGGVPHAMFSPPDLAWYTLFHAVKERGAPVLRNYVEALECLALVGDPADVEYLRGRFRESAAGRVLAALESFRRAFFPGSRDDTVSRFLAGRPPRSLRMFGKEASFLPGADWTPARDIRLQFHFAQGLRRRLRFFGVKLFPPRELMSNFPDLAARPRPVAWCVRLWRLAVRGTEGPPPVPGSPGTV